MSMPPPINKSPEDSDPKPESPKTWRDWSLGEITDKATRVGLALWAGFKTAKEIITEKKEGE